MRWSKAVEEGLQFMYSFMSAELEVRQSSALECRELDDDGTPTDCGKCDGCRQTEALTKGLAWVGWQIDKHTRR